MLLMVSRHLIAGQLLAWTHKRVSLNRGHIIAYNTVRKCNRIANFIKFTCISLMLFLCYYA